MSWALGGRATNSPSQVLYVGISYSHYGMFNSTQPINQLYKWCSERHKPCTVWHNSTKHCYTQQPESVGDWLKWDNSLGPVTDDTFYQLQMIMILHSFIYLFVHHSSSAWLRYTIPAFVSNYKHLLNWRRRHIAIGDEMQSIPQWNILHPAVFRYNLCMQIYKAGFNSHICCIQKPFFNSLTMKISQVLLGIHIKFARTDIMGMSDWTLVMKLLPHPHLYLACAANPIG